MHIYFIRNRGEIMKQNKKIAITHYISIRFSAIIFIMAAIMILFISYFSNKTIYFDIRRQIRKETHYDFLNIDIQNGKIFVNKNFIFEEDHVQKIILDSQGDFFRGHYPDKKLKNIPVNQWHFQKVKCSSDYYYIYDRPYLKKDTITNKRVLVIVRNIGKASDFDSQYKTKKYISYTFTFVIAFIGFLLIGIVSSQLTIPMKKIKDTADKIGTDGDLAKRIEYTTPFKELDAMIQANNRMMDRLEDLFQQQQQFTSDVRKCQVFLQHFFKKIFNIVYLLFIIYNDIIQLQLQLFLSSFLKKCIEKRLSSGSHFLYAPLSFILLIFPFH